MPYGQTDQLELILHSAQRTLSSLELPRAVPVANTHSPKNESPTFADQDKGDSDRSSTFQQNGRRATKNYDPARDLSIQVLEKFSLVTRFARETTSQLFRESQFDGFTPFEERKDTHVSPADRHSTASNESLEVLDEVSVPSDPVEVIISTFMYLFPVCKKLSIWGLLRLHDTLMSIFKNVLQFGLL